MKLKPLSHFLSFLLVATLLSAILVPAEVRAETTATVDIPLELGRNIFEANSSHRTNPTTYFIDGQSGGGGRALFRFNISSIPGTIISASLQIDCISYKTQQIIEVRMLKGAFTTSTGWWDHPDYETYTPPGSVNTAASLLVGLKNYDITAIVKGWQTGTYTNYGLLLRGNNNNDGNIIFGVPVLHVTYTAPLWSPSFTSTPPLTGEVGTIYTYTPTTNESATITAPTLPAWATYSGGTISGTPTEPGTFAFQVRAVSTAGTLAVNQWWNVTVEAAPIIPTWPPTFTSTPPDAGTVGEEYSYTPICNETASFELESFPDWAGWAEGGVIGIPNEAGTFSFSLKATSTAGTLSSWQNWTVMVEDATPVPVISGAPPEHATKRVWYQWTPSVDLPNCYWTVTGAGWLTINQYTGKVSGLPTSAGTYNITITALSTEYGTSTSLNYLLTVADVLDPPADTDDDTTDPGGDNGDGIQAIPQTYLIAGIAIFALLVIVLAIRR